MKNLFLKLAIIAVTVGAIGSCKKDETQVVLNNSANPQLSATATAATITKATGSSPAVTYTWAPAEFGYQAAVNYTLQFAIQGTNFASPTEFNLGNSLTKSFTVKELNDLYNAINCSLSATPAPITLEARVKATVGDAAAASMSGLKTITASPYPDFVTPTKKWGLVGPAGDGWPGATATDRFLTYDCKVRAYVLKTTLNAGPFKFRRDTDWGTNLGGPTGDLSKGIALAPNGPDLVITAPGVYTIKLEVSPDGDATAVGSGKVTVTK